MRRTVVSCLVVLLASPAFGADATGKNADGSVYAITLDPRESPSLDPLDAVTIALQAKAQPIVASSAGGKVTPANPGSQPTVTQVDLLRHYDIDRAHPRLSSNDDALVWVVQMRGKFEALRQPPGTMRIVGRDGYVVIDDATGEVLKSGFLVDVEASSGESIKQGPRGVVKASDVSDMPDFTQGGE